MRAGRVRDFYALAVSSKPPAVKGTLNAVTIHRASIAQMGTKMRTVRTHHMRCLTNVTPKNQFLPEVTRGLDLSASEFIAGNDRKPTHWKWKKWDAH
jgi:hypothetical protein